MGTVLITGGHAGIGFTASQEIASRLRLDLVLAGRSPERMERAAGQLNAGGAAKVVLLPLDVSSLGSVRSASAQLTAMLDRGEIAPLQAIVCNAGGQFRGPISYSADGYEDTFATNHLGHFLLVNLLLDRLVPNGRVVFTASGTHDPDTADGRMVGKVAEPNALALANDGRNGAKPLSGGVRYSTSKLCTMLFAYELDRRLRATGSSVASIAFDPGSIPETGLLRTMPKPVQWLAKTRGMKFMMRRMGVTQGSVDFSGTSLGQSPPPRTLRAPRAIIFSPTMAT
ncbi:NAD(P)-dependent dehydrogenase, short-chain alcohol dehydrogenase family [Fulvimarina manganoxydans]|uniref:NAD(P)-dependent dehydrogenase, short-chain alcohol dehydrogenase family n=1 Tax=Fulvimarina manganoxydans TaxID=937218 RepID=A0A1W2EX74_9HYPH|nr:SDR family NAD(P)-dependent oxidoreductase [Fulvimarina manganoxydans]SMD14319.1 NAD(P)-dependent dehydrogenase, short-chain alcohol dehydrogenase family [Fulvimarina manganoxydans]